MPVCYSNVRSVSAHGMPSPSSATISPENLRATAELSIPKGGSVSFKYKTSDGTTSTTSSFRNETTAYGTSDEMLLKKKEGENYTVDINNKITSITAFIKDASGNVTEKDLLAKPEVAKPEVSKPAELAAQVKPEVKSPVEQQAALPDLSALTMPRTQRLAVTPEVAPVAPIEIPMPAVKVPAVESKVDNSPAPSASVPMSPPVEFDPSIITDDGPGISSKAPMSDIIEDEQELAPITNSEIAKDVWDKIEAGATAPIDSGLTARSIGSGTSEVSPFEEVPSEKSVAKASPVTKPEPKVNTLDLTKLVPGKTYNYKVIDGPEKGTSGSFTVPTNGDKRDIAGVYRGYLHKNEDGSYRFENINPNKCEVTALDGKRAESTIASNSSLGQASTEKASELSKKDIKKLEREEKREDRKLELSDGTKIKLGGKPPELTGAQVKDFLNKYPDQKALIIVGAEWCGPCRNYEPSYTEYAKRNPNVAVIHVDSDHNQEFVSSNSVSSLPTTLLKASGSTTISPKQDGHVGGMGVSELERRYGK